MLPEIQVIEGTEEAAAMLTPLRLKLLELLKEPSSATKLAIRLKMPRQMVNYHLRELEKRKLVVHVEDHRKGNCTERFLQRSADSFLIGPDTLGNVAALPERTPDRLSAAYLIATAAKLIRDLGKILVLAARQKKTVATLTLHSRIRFANPEQRAEFVREVASEMLRIAAKYNDEQAAGGRDFEWIFGAYPSLKEDFSSSPPQNAE